MAFSYLLVNSILPLSWYNYNRFIMTKRIIYTIAIALFIVSIAGLVISYGRGYRLNFERKTISPTGILSASSSPDGASVWVDNRLVSATNTSISLPPGWYDIRISKEGYQSWQKRIKILGEVVNKAEALLIPTNPSLRAITSTGVYSPSLSPTGTRVAYIVPTTEATESASLKSKTGVWILDLRPGPLGRKNEPKQVYQVFSTSDLENGRIFWSHDEKQIILGFVRDDQIYRALQFSLSNSNPIPTEVSKNASETLDTWQQETEELLKTQLENQVKPPIATLLSNSATNIVFSPDGNKILYQATDSAQIAPVITPPLIGSNPTVETRNIKDKDIYVYDTKEDKNFILYESAPDINPKLFQWHVDSKHIFTIEKDAIIIIDYDGTNKRTVYAGPFEKSTIFASPTSSQLIILTNLNNPEILPNLYELDLR